MTRMRERETDREMKGGSKGEKEGKGSYKGGSGGVGPGQKGEEGWRREGWGRGRREVERVICWVSSCGSAPQPPRPP